MMVIGSGPIVIGQAAEFDYAGTQACRALKEEGLEVVLVNSNPATIMTDNNMADSIYIEPLSLEVVKRIILKEKPDGLLSTLGGQTGLTMSMQLAREVFWKNTGLCFWALILKLSTKRKTGRCLKTRWNLSVSLVVPSKVVKYDRRCSGFRGGNRLSGDHSSRFYSGRYRRRHRK